jgi:hypothetical protein
LNEENANSTLERLNVTQSFNTTPKFTLTILMHTLPCLTARLDAARMNAARRPIVSSVGGLTWSYVSEID